jgi:hypothetical protein
MRHKYCYPKKGVTLSIIMLCNFSILCFCFGIAFHFSVKHVFLSFYYLEIKRCFFIKVITWHYIVVQDWINLIVEMIKPQGVLCKML